MRRAEGFYADEMPAHTVGTTIIGKDNGDDYPLAMLWLPNPEKRRGWELRGVFRPEPDKPTRRMGYPW